MPTVNVFETEGFDDIKWLFRRLRPAQLSAYLHGIVRMSVLLVKSDALPYPPNGIWNSPSNPSGHWYVRHLGPCWRRKDGSVHCKATSEKMQKRWGDSLVVEGANITGELYNTASYANEVIGSEQRPYHKLHGWRTVNDWLKTFKTKHMPVVIRRLLAVVHADYPR